MSKLIVTALCAALLLCGTAQASLWGWKQGAMPENMRVRGYPAVAADPAPRRRQARKALPSRAGNSPAWGHGAAYKTWPAAQNAVRRAKAPRRGYLLPLLPPPRRPATGRSWVGQLLSSLSLCASNPELTPPSFSPLQALDLAEFLKDPKYLPFLQKVRTVPAHTIT